MCDLSFGVSRISTLCFKIIVLKTRGKKRKRSDTDLNAPKAPLPVNDRFLNERHENIFPGRPQKVSPWKF